MNTLWVPARARITRLLSRGSALALPLALMLILAGVFRNGHPFERHRVVFDGNSTTADQQLHLRARFSHSEEIRFELASDRGHALRLLQTGMASVVFTRDPGEGQLRLLVAPTEVLFGWGLAAELPRPVELAIVPVPHFAYVNFLLPGVLTLSLLTFCVRAAGQGTRTFRQLGRSSAPWNGLRFVVGACARAVGLGLVQVALLVLTAHLLCGLALSFQSVAIVLALSLAGLLTFTGLGVLFSSWVEAESARERALHGLLLPLALLSEVAFMLDELPRGLRALGELLPTTHLVRLLREALLDGRVEASRLALGVAFLVGVGFVGFVLGVWRLWRREVSA